MNLPNKSPIIAAGAIVLGAGLLFGRRAMAAPRSSAPEGPAASAIYRAPRYPPRSNEAVMLFTSAARYLKKPDSWASDPGLHNILEKESAGYVGRPNYQFGLPIEKMARWPEVWRSLQDGTWRLHLAEPWKSGPRANQSSATGLGQLITTNVAHYYPSGLAGVGRPLEEAIGMLAYIADRYGTPANAWAKYGKGHEGY